MVLKNRSRIFYQIAGNKSRLGQGKAITYLHGTETASWGSEEGLASLIASLAEKNPERLYMFESTAQGFNMYHDMYKTAKTAKTQRAIFCGWWRNEYYSADPDSNIYKTYWDGKLTGEEKEWTKEIKKLYGVEINTRQIAWWRWKIAGGHQRRNPDVPGVPAYRRLRICHDGHQLLLQQLGVRKQPRRQSVWLQRCIGMRLVNSFKTPRSSSQRRGWQRCGSGSNL